ncbi:MAG: M48 family metallopeptidase [Gammaproteobacteria bacterium]|nr:M48 family metallopeptidase [Gammaproteobacteria bacterium]
MEYTNPELPEGINTSDTHPLKEFFLLTIGVLAFIFIAVTLLIIIVDNFADKIPFEMEKNLPVESFITGKSAETLPPYLDKVSQKVIKSFELPENMHITVHYLNEDMVNAFATLGGHIALYRGLLDKLKYEDELAMVIAHEVAHIKYRHPILSTSHGIVVGLALSIFSSASGNAVINQLMGTTGMASLMRFSRDFEYQADKDAVKSLIKLYGHAEGGIGLFNVFKSEFGKESRFEFLATHPLTENRISQTTKIINANSLSSGNVMTELPGEFKLWLKKQKDKTEN